MPDHPDQNKNKRPGIDPECLARIRDAIRQAGLDPDEAPDIVERVARRLLDEAAPPVENLVAYLRTVARRAKIDQARRDDRRAAHERQAGSPDTPPPPEEDADALETRTRLRTIMLDQLSLDERWLIKAHYYDQRSLRDMASEAGVSHETIRKQLWRAIEKLRRALSAS